MANEKVKNALKAMKNMGVSDDTTKTVLKKLLKVYGNNWELIEEENYRALADAIFESAEEQQKGDEGKNRSPDSKGPPSKKPHLELQVHKTLSKNKKGQMRSFQRSVKETDIANVAKEASRMGSSQQLVNGHSDSSAGHQPSVTDKKHSGKISDISRGKEKWKISLIDSSRSEDPLNFTYIRENLVYQDAYVRFSLARIADDSCCRGCKGNCLTNSVPCRCSCETGGEFAYTLEGLLRDEFLQRCIDTSMFPKNHDHFYCANCPLERQSDDGKSEPCKGHLIRKFIKECWNKCGCDMACGNRIVQRGISCQLQVFLTEGKGWGLRTLEALPKGAFVCEYVGEILTNTELWERNELQSQNGRHRYPITLDADWSAERVLKDDEALCLDATNFGNVARFINHRCYDANLIDIPVEVETPDHHYYHIAFFTKRRVEASEELTWDYKIDFNDHSHPIEAFGCCCGSEYCRDRNSKKLIKGHPDVGSSRGKKAPKAAPK